MEIKTHELGLGVYMLEGAGGNIGVSVGKDGVVLIDDQFAPLTDKIVAAVKKLSDQPIRFLINTHYHGDHTGGNENLGKAGVLIFAHDNVRQRLLEGVNAPALNRVVPPAPPAALPVVTFSEDTTFHLNGDTLHVFHVEPAHTDGDSMIHFRNADVIHTGDVFRTTGYPSVDAAAGGSFMGILRGYERLMAMAGPNTKILPGHGAVSTREDVKAQYDIFVSFRDQVSAAKRQGKSLDAIKAMKITAAHDAAWGSGRVTGDMLIEQVFAELP